MPQAINAWNKLNNSLKETVNYKLFKAFLEKDSPKVNPLFYLGDRKVNIIMARLGMNCSDRKGYLAQLNIIGNSVCKCGYPFEDSLSLLFHLSYLSSSKSCSIYIFLHYFMPVCICFMTHM